MLLILSVCIGTGWARQVDVPGPVGSELFGLRVVPLPNGNYVVTDPMFDDGGRVDIGAVYLFAPDHRLISRLVGTRNGDRVGSDGIDLLPASGNYVVSSPFWDNGSIQDAGAVTLCEGDTGLEAEVSPGNSLVGSHSGDSVGRRLLLANDIAYGVRILRNGNFLVLTGDWNSGRGAVTWSGEIVGTFGEVSAANSLIGTAIGDLRNVGIRELASGITLLLAPGFDLGDQQDVGAIRRIDTEVPTTGSLSSANAFTGASSSDALGQVTELPGGKIVVMSFNFRVNGVSAGAVWTGDPSSLPVGALNPETALLGRQAGDLFLARIVVLANGNFLVHSPNWDYDANAFDAGAVTWMSSVAPKVGQIDASNSLVGDAIQDRLGSSGISPLTGGNYVICTPGWDADTGVNQGAATWGNGSVGSAGIVSAANSLVGVSSGDAVCSAVVDLANGHYVVVSDRWLSRGAATWGNGNSGVAGPVSSANSLVSTFASSSSPSISVAALSNGHYVVASATWANGIQQNAGAVAWVNGNVGAQGQLGPSNALVGTRQNERIGETIGVLTNGNYVLVSPRWQDANDVPLGAITWRDGTIPTAGLTIGAHNSLLGAQAGQLDSAWVQPLSNGHFLVVNPSARVGSATGAGLVSWGNGFASATGILGPSNSLLGSQSGDNIGRSVVVSETGYYLVGSRQWDNGTIANVGTVIRGSLTTGISGVVSSQNALIGNQMEDQIGWDLLPQSTGDLVIRSPVVDHAGVLDAGANTLVRGSGAMFGPISGANSVLGVAQGFNQVSTAYDPVRRRLFVGRFQDQIVSIRSFNVLLSLTASAGSGADAIVLTGTLTGSLPQGSLAFTYGADVPIPGCEAVPLFGAGDVRSASCDTSTLPSGQNQRAGAIRR